MSEISFVNTAQVPLYQLSTNATESVKTTQSRESLALLDAQKQLAEKVDQAREAREIGKLVMSAETIEMLETENVEAGQTEAEEVSDSQSEAVDEGSDSDGDEGSDSDGDEGYGSDGDGGSDSDGDGRGHREAVEESHNNTQQSGLPQALKSLEQKTVEGEVVLGLTTRVLGSSSDQRIIDGGCDLTPPFGRPPLGQIPDQIPDQIGGVPISDIIPDDTDVDKPSGGAAYDIGNMLSALKRSPDLFLMMLSNELTTLIDGVLQLCLERQQERNAVMADLNAVMAELRKLAKEYPGDKEIPAGALEKIFVSLHPDSPLRRQLEEGKTAGEIAQIAGETGLVAGGIGQGVLSAVDDIVYGPAKAAAAKDGKLSVADILVAYGIYTKGKLPNKGETLDVAVENITAKVNTMSSEQQIHMLTIQKFMNGRNEAFSTSSNVNKSAADNRGTIVGNLRG